MLMLLWYESALNWRWEKAQRIDEIFFVVAVIIKQQQHFVNIDIVLYLHELVC